MAKLELARELALSPEEAWEHVSDLNALGDWLVMHEGWRGEVPAELSVGTQIVGVAGAKGLRNRVTWTIKKFDPPKLIEVAGNGVGGTRYGLTMKVAATEVGSAFTLILNLGGAPLFGPVGAAAARAVRGDIDRSIRRFEELYS